MLKRMKLSRVGLAAAVVCSLASPALAQENDDAGWFEAEETEEAPEPEPDRAADEPVTTAPKPEAKKHEQVHVQRTGEDCEGSCDKKWKRHRGLRPKSSRALSLVVGRARLEAPELSEALERAGFQGIDELRMVGIHGTRVRGRLVLGLGASFAWSDQLEREDGAGGRLTLGQLRGNLGWALVHSEKWLLYPAFELTGTRFELDLGAGGSQSFDEALAQPTSGSELVRHSLAAGGVLAIERRFPIQRHRKRERAPFFSIGLRAGWMREIVAGPWRVDGDGDARGPEEPFDMKYIGITAGFGSASF